MAEKNSLKYVMLDFSLTIKGKESKVFSDLKEGEYFFGCYSWGVESREEFNQKAQDNNIALWEKVSSEQAVLSLENVSDKFFSISRRVNFEPQEMVIPISDEIAMLLIL